MELSGLGFLFLASLLSACGLPTAAQDTPEADALTITVTQSLEENAWTLGSPHLQTPQIREEAGSERYDSFRSVSSMPQVPRNPQVLLTNATLTASSTTVTEHKDSLTLLCETQETAVTIHWFFQNHPLVLDAHMSLSDDNRNLTFTTVQRTDFGTYQCEIQNASHSLKSNIQNIVVNYGPDPFTITLDIENANWKMEEVPRGSHVTFSVNIQSYPPPNFTWTVPYNVEQPITTFRFSIPHITGKHSGTYRCVVSNLVTQLTHMDTLEIQVPDHLTPPSILVSSDFLVESDTGPPVNLTCRTNHADLSVHWLLGGQPLQPNERLVLSTDNRTLAIYRLRRSDTGPYQCLVWDSTSEARSDPVHLDIYYGPDQVNISSSTQDMPRPVLEAALGSNLTLNCQADAHPSPQYHWTSRNRTYATNQLIFEALTWEDDGVHICTATNPQTGKSSSNSVVLRLGGPSPALSAGAIAGITVGVVAAIPATVGLLHLCGIIRIRYDGEKCCPITCECTCDSTSFSCCLENICCLKNICCLRLCSSFCRRKEDENVNHQFSLNQSSPSTKRR